MLEQEAETTAAEHQQAVDAATDAFKAAQEAAAQQLQEAQAAAAGQLQQAGEQREAEIAKVQVELAAVKVSAAGNSSTRGKQLARRCCAIVACQSDML